MGEREKPGEKDGDVLLHKWEGGGGPRGANGSDGGGGNESGRTRETQRSRWKWDSAAKKRAAGEKREGRGPRRANEGGLRERHQDGWRRRRREHDGRDVERQ